MSPSPAPRRLREVGLVFLRLGFVSFGGPAAGMLMPLWLAWKAG